jgi:hypothetical protein
MQHLLDLESARRPSSNYLAKQREITIQHRHRLVDWMSRLCHRLKYDQETLHLAVNYLDRFLTKKNVPVYRMKLVGTACLFVAGKFEETSPSTAEDYLLAMTGLDGSIGDGGRGDASGVPMGDLLSMESCLIDTLQFDLSTATANVFACHLMDSSLPAVDSFDRLRFKSLVNVSEIRILVFTILFNGINRYSI